MDKCRNWKHYKGKHKPRCNGGLGCVKCLEIYNVEDEYRKVRDARKRVRE